MTEPAVHISAITEYLSHHRYEPPERDGWHSLYDLQSGIGNELHLGLRTIHVVRVLDNLMGSQPPLVEDTWMLSDEIGLPVLDTHYEHPNQPKGSHRFYRYIGALTEYFKPEE